MEPRTIRKRLAQVRAALQRGERIEAERIEAELHAEVLHWIATEGRGAVRIRAQLAMATRQLWLE